MAPPSKRSSKTGRKSDSVEQKSDTDINDGSVTADGNWQSPSRSKSPIGQKRKRVGTDEEESFDYEESEVKRSKVGNDDTDETSSTQDGIDVDPTNNDNNYTVSGTKVESIMTADISTVAMPTKTIVSNSETPAPPSMMTSLIEPTRSVPTIDRLRIPSKHTPGKTKDVVSVPRYTLLEPDVRNFGSKISTESSKRAGLALDTPKPSRYRSDIRVPVEENRVSSEGLLNSRDDVQYIQPADFSAISSSVNESAEKSMENVTKPKQSVLRHPFLWVCIFFIPYLHFVLPDVVLISNRLMVVYKDVFSNDTQITTDFVRIGGDIDEIQQLLKTLDEVQEMLQNKQNLLSADIPTRLSHLLEDFSFQNKKISSSRLSDLGTNMTKISKVVKDFLKHTDEEFLPLYTNLLSIRHGLSSNLHVVDLSGLQLWRIEKIKVQNESCHDQEENLDAFASLISESDFNAQYEQLLSNVTANIVFMKEDASIMETFKTWIRDTAMTVIQESQGEISTVEVNHIQNHRSNGLSRYINSRLEVEIADQTRLVDYASLANGAVIITSGPVATSPSLVDTLPLLNRLAHSLNLRFYGHGPEAALTPTYPTYGLGQCWSLTEDLNDVSGYGTLSIRLAQPIYVTNVSIEHPTPEVSDRVNTAIRLFRIIGFENATDPSAKSYKLGTFEFKTGASFGIRQTFRVITENIPLLTAVSLAIDENWGGEYTCLYRFRVHGHA